MNARSLMNFFELRCCERAQWEIRDVATQMLALVRKACPTLFKNAGPRCLKGPAQKKEDVLRKDRASKRKNSTNSENEKWENYLL